jgi:hypothetical protein
MSNGSAVTILAEPGLPAVAGWWGSVPTGVFSVTGPFRAVAAASVEEHRPRQGNVRSD